MNVTLMLGLMLSVSHSVPLTVVVVQPARQESEVTKRRLDAASTAMHDALAAMDTKKGMMNGLDSAVNHLRLLVSLGETQSDVRTSVDLATASHWFFVVQRDNVDRLRNYAGGIPGK